jgi:hypothetical protein
LEENRVDARTLQLVKGLTQELFLQFCFVSRLRILMSGPVHATKGAKPYGAHFALRRGNDVTLPSNRE